MDRATNPLFSIVIPALNEEKNIPELLQSIHNQSYRPIEVIVVDDASTDRTAQLTHEFASRFGDEHLSIFLVRGVDESPRGPAYARNLGIGRARGDCVLIIDGDFILSDGEIIRQLFTALQDNNAARFRASVRTDGWVEHNLALDKKTPLFLRHESSSVTGLALRRAVLENLAFDVALGMGEDKDLLMRLESGGISNPVVISATGLKHLPHTLGELRDRRRWYGRTSILWLGKYHSPRDFFVLSPSIPLILLLAQLVAFAFSGVLGLAFAAAFLAIPLIAFAQSPVKDGTRMIYLIFVRYIYGSFWFSLGVVQGIIQLLIRRHINPSK